MNDADALVQGEEDTGGLDDFIEFGEPATGNAEALEESSGSDEEFVDIENI